MLQIDPSSVHTVYNSTVRARGFVFTPLYSPRFWIILFNCSSSSSSLRTHKQEMSKKNTINKGIERTSCLKWNRLNSDGKYFHHLYPVIESVVSVVEMVTPLLTPPPPHLPTSPTPAVDALPQGCYSKHDALLEYHNTGF